MVVKVNGVVMILIGREIRVCVVVLMYLLRLFLRLLVVLILVFFDKWFVRIVFWIFGLYWVSFVNLLWFVVDVVFRFVRLIMMVFSFVSFLLFVKVLSWLMLLVSWCDRCRVLLLWDIIMMNGFLNLLIWWRFVLNRLMLILGVVRMMVLYL